jgi:hypothetical protein
LHHALQLRILQARLHCVCSDMTVQTKEPCPKKKRPLRIARVTASGMGADVV